MRASLLHAATSVQKGRHEPAGSKLLVGKLLHATALVVLVSRTDWRREVREAAARLQGEGEDRPVELAPAPGVDEDGGREGGGAAEMREGREAESGRAALIGRAPPDGESAKV